MDWMSTTQLLGNVGEFIGAVAVLTTLVYLSFQVRQGSRTLQWSERRATTEQFDRWRTALLDPAATGL